jgi:3'-phosphoadenosine 5'-phosphosulfate sulfotransferase (PAPS reductase)/FAD synthetase
MMGVDATSIEAALDRHQRVAFHFSGGRDSTAALYAMQPYWDRLSIYHVNTNDQFPETADVVRMVESDVGPMIHINSDADATRQEYGLPTDVLPVDNQLGFGRFISGRQIKLMPRYECCARVLMIPMHQQMLQDGITLIVRGARNSEFAVPPTQSGHRDEHYELLHPIQEWSDQDVMDYLAANGLPVAPFYEHGMSQAPECMGCTAWWGEGRLGYLRKHYPEQYADVAAKMRVIKIEIDRQYDTIKDMEIEV